MDIEKDKLPKHVAIIMDGNGRWAKKQGFARVFGHKSGVRSVRDSIKVCLENRISCLTLYAFSEENWARPKMEVSTIMNLMVSSMKDELSSFLKNGVRFRYIGDDTRLSDSMKEEFDYCVEQTAHCQNMTLVIAVNYSAQTEIVSAARKIASDVAEGKLKVEEINKSTIENHLYTAGLPPVDLLIRTSGEQRISNFLLWQIAYSELYFSPVLWPDFSEKIFTDILKDFTSRERRYGKTSEQLEQQNK
ncbi:MAG: polyprenyl diphosphate synthase [Flavobacteriales bacterium]|nr:polyprenyl diphosphate synthase [Flavobacteriales bacterium]